MYSSINKLKELRKSKGWTQEETAERLNIDVRSWKSYEYGDRNMPLDILISTAILFNVTTDYLLDLSEEKQPQAKEFQQATGFSESAIANISKYKKYSAFMDCINQFISSSEFIDVIGNIMIAKSQLIQNGTIDKQAVIQGANLFEIALGRKKKDKNTKVTLIGERLDEWELWQASLNIHKLIDRILKGDMENGKC